MDKLIIIVSWILLICCTFEFFWGPTFFGKIKKAYAVTHWLVGNIFRFMYILLIGRCLGWW